MKKTISYLLIFAIILGWVNFHLLTQITSYVGDGDRPYIIWTIYQNIYHLKTLDFGHFFDTNAFYPHRQTLFLSDTLLPQSFIAFFFSLFIDNPAFVFNLVYLATYFLNFLSLYFFWRLWFKKEYLAFLGSLLFVFSPYYFSQNAHFQMISYWPLFFSLIFLIKSFKSKFPISNKAPNSKNLRYPLLSGFFLAIQFLASVYLAVFLIVMILIYEIIVILLAPRSSPKLASEVGFNCYIAKRDKKVFLDLFIQETIKLVIIFSVFFLLDGVFIKGYFEVKKNYGMHREYGEYVTYSAHLSDYLFTTGMDTALYRNFIFQKWNGFNLHNIGERALFPGFLLSGLSILYCLSLTKRIDKDKLRLIFFAVLVIVGFSFSLGPRLNFNGYYAKIPTPYTFLVKYIPLFEPVRASARWSFFVYLGLIYFCLRFLENKKKFILILVSLWFLLEYLPLPARLTDFYETKPEYSTLKKLSQSATCVLLELPVTHLNVSGGIYVGLNYLSKLEYASLDHHCFLINGYSGYLFPELISLDLETTKLLETKQFMRLNDLLKKQKAQYLLINFEKLNFSQPTDIGQIKKDLPFKNIYGNLYSL